jgi:membrane-associated protein
MLQNIVDAITAFLRQNNNPLGFLILSLSALVEYVFPPFPGDTVTLFGAFLVVRYAWSLVLVFSSVMAGSAVGAMLDYMVGSALGRRYRQGGLVKSEKRRRKIERVLAAFRRWGPAYVVINRFLPGVRAAIFVAAGMAGLKAGWVLFFALVSAALWNALILAAGYALGANWDAIVTLYEGYQRVVWIALVVVAAALLVRWLWRRGRGRPSG